MHRKIRKIPLYIHRHGRHKRQTTTIRSVEERIGDVLSVQSGRDGELVGVAAVVVGVLEGVGVADDVDVGVEG